MYTTVQVVQYMCLTGLPALILGYVIGRIVDRVKVRGMRIERNLHLRARVIAEEKTDEYKGKYLIYKGMTELGQTPK